MNSCRVYQCLSAGLSLGEAAMVMEIGEVVELNSTIEMVITARNIVANYKVLKLEDLSKNGLIGASSGKKLREALLKRKSE